MAGSQELETGGADYERFLGVGCAKGAIFGLTNRISHFVEAMSAPPFPIEKAMQVFLG